MTKNKLMTKTTFAITFLTITLMMVPAASIPAFANHTTTVSPSGEPTLSLNGNCYAHIPSSGLNYDQAFNDAQIKSVNGVPGHLATLNSVAEDVLTLAFPQGWIGYTRDLVPYVPAGSPTNVEQDGFAWGWVTGEPIVHTNWSAPQEPNNANSNELYATHNTFGGKWNDIDFNGFGNSIPGYVVEFEGACPDVDDEVCDDTDQVCKSVVITEETDDGVILVGELIWYDFLIDVNNDSGITWFFAIVQDRLGGDLETDGTTITDNLTCTLGTPDAGTNPHGKKKGGNTQKEFLDCTEAGDGHLDNGEHADVSFSAHTDINPGQGKPGGQNKNEYTSCGEHAANSGGTVLYWLDDTDPPVVPPQVLKTPSITVDVFDATYPESDCDGDGLDDDEDGLPFDFDDDGVNGLDDNCPNDFNDGQEDADGDGKGDVCDNAPNDFNPNQKDSDDDGVGDVADQCPDSDPINNPPIDPWGCDATQTDA